MDTEFVCCAVGEYNCDYITNLLDQSELECNIAKDFVCSKVQNPQYKDGVASQGHAHTAMK